MIIAAGLAVVAKNTGRVLLLQRSLQDDKDPNAGLFEFPGGKLNPGEKPLMGAVREWTEETGNKLPKGKITNKWISSDGKYKGYVYAIPSEDSIIINLDQEDKKVLNPDDPDGDFVETLAFMDPVFLPDNPILRPEMHDMDWELLKMNTTILKQIDNFLIKYG